MDLDPSLVGPPANPGGKLWSELVNPRTLRLSAALIRDVSCDSGTEVSPLYMKSTIHWTSQPRTSFKTMMGCLQGLSVNIFWKYGLEKKIENQLVNPIVHIGMYLVVIKA